MEKQLPDKVVTQKGDGVTSGDYYSPEARAINQLIDYLEELAKKINEIEITCHTTQERGLR